MASPRNHFLVRFLMTFCAAWIVGSISAKTAISCPENLLPYLHSAAGAFASQLFTGLLYFND